jgi:ubiquinone/menaquinone biosynthesis C-methylase UbiE
MPHRFDPRHLWFLNNPIRKLTMPPEPILTRIGVRPGIRFADIGAGSGYYSFPAAGLVGAEGRVYALDIEPEATAYLRREKEKRTMTNLEVVLSTDASLGLDPRSIDIVFMSAVFHEVEDRGRMLGLVKEALRDGGRLAIIEFDRGALVMGPPESERIGRDEMRGELLAAGFRDPLIEGLGRGLYLSVAVSGV